ncbi:MAG: transcription termination/antitermination protein NusA [Rickettsiales bacterium]|nr:transcription termination/antitermination protein NusA [Rickettsiales bacterium]
MSQYISGNTELIKVAQAVASEKGISSESVIDAIEQAIKVAAKKKYGNDYLIEASVDRKTGSFKIYRKLLVVEKVEDANQEISVDQVKASGESYDSIILGDYVNHNLPPVDVGRLVAQVVKQVIVQKIRNAETDKNYEQFKSKINQIVTGVVKKVGPRGALLDISGVEAFLDKGDSIPNEVFKQNERVRALVKDIQKKETGLQIYLTRTSNEFLVKLFAQEVPEIFDGIIQIKSVSREPGARAKVGVHAVESSLDPVGACVGVRGSRVQVVISELKGEKIDIIEWSSDPAKFVVNALVPARVLKVIIDEDRGVIEAVVSDSDYSLAIGRKGQNARLASKLSGWNIDVLTEDSESESRKEESKRIYDLFTSELDGVDELAVRILIAEGFTHIDELLLISEEELSTFEGFDLEKAKLLQKKASAYIQSPNYREYKFASLGLDVVMKDVVSLSPELAAILARKRIKTLDSLADLSRDELVDIIGSDLEVPNKELDDVIMDARKIAFGI